MNESFSVGNVLGRGFGIYFRNFIPFTLLAAVIYLPIILWTYVVFSNDNLSLEAISHWQKIEPILKLLLSSLLTATLTFGVVKELQGERASIGACVATGFKRMLPALGVGIVTGLAIVGGLILIIIPGIIALCMLYVATPVSVIEKPGVFDSLRRSRELTSGYKGSIFGIVFILFLLAFAAVFILQSAYTPTTIHQLRTFAILTVAIDLFFAAIGSVMAAVAYYLLRAEKEGTSAHELASVFE
jgi:hypothetical protein